MRTILLMLSLCIGGMVHAGPGRDAFDAFMQGLTTLEARFEQSVLDTENARQGLFHGVFTLKRPGRFRWDYVAPEQRHIIADGSSLWIVDDDLNHVTQYPQEMALKGSPATLLLSNEPLEKAFEVAEIGERLDMQWLELLPRDQDGDIVRVLLAFKEQRLLRLELTDTFGQISRFSFFEIKRNPALADELFDYQPPDDWDVLNNI